MQANLKELSPAKINLFLKIVSKRDDGYHNIRSGVTLINLFDEVVAEKNSKFSLKYIGEFSPENNKFKDCIVEKIFTELDLEKPNYAFTIKKNIPIMSGLGSASSNAAAVIRILEKLNYVDLKKKNFANIGADVPFFIYNHDSLIKEIGNITIRQYFPKYYFLLIKPLHNCSTKKMYTLIKSEKLNFDVNYDTDVINEEDNGNDFEPILEKHSNEIKNLLKFMRGLPDAIFSRLTGSGSCIFSVFESKKKAEESLSIFTKRFPLIWAKVVENNFIQN
tara:strand:+ start:558 stop:1388 length:831 start_codon:yes stop_codon:yes gene_type:complete